MEIARSTCTNCRANGFFKTSRFLLRWKYTYFYDGNTRIAKPGECCTESFIVAGAFSTKKEVESYKTYLFTKIVRFLLLQTVVSQHVTKDKFIFIPDLGKYEGVYTDEMLCKRWGITKEEWEFIDSKIKSVNDINNAANADE